MENRIPSHRGTVVLALFAAIIVVLAFTPLGFIPLPFIKMTIIHIPVILGALLLGPKCGACLGFLFGLTSLINNTISPAITSLDVYKRQLLRQIVRPHKCSYRIFHAHIAS